jgi:hypothetical protein
VPVVESDFLKDFSYDNHRKRDYDDVLVVVNQNYLDVGLVHDHELVGILNEMEIVDEGVVIESESEIYVDEGELGIAIVAVVVY